MDNNQNNDQGLSLRQDTPMDMNQTYAGADMGPQPMMYDQPPVYTVPNPGAVPSAPAPKKKTGLIIGICIAVVAVVAAVLCIFVFDVFGLRGAKDQGSAEAVCKKLFKSMEDADADALLECFPEDIGASLGIMDLHGSKEEIQTALSLMKSFGLKFKSISVHTSEKLDADAVKADLKAKGSDIDVKEAEKVHISATMSVSAFGETQEQTQDMDVVCGKVGGKWYILSED